MTEPHKVMDYRERQMHDGQEYKKQENRIRALEAREAELVRLCQDPEIMSPSSLTRMRRELGARGIA